jgi:hypothetical protein
MPNTPDLAGAPATTNISATTGNGASQPLAEPEGLTLERDRLEARGRDTEAARQLQRAAPGWRRMLEQLTWRALERLAGNEPLDPNDRDIWQSRDAHAEAVLRRHGLGRIDTRRLTLAAIHALTDGQRELDRQAGIRWDTLLTPAELTARLCEAHRRPPIDLDDPGVWTHRADQRRTLAHRLGLTEEPTRLRSTPASCAAGGSPRHDGFSSPPSASVRSVRSTGR